jgi:ATP-dependent protease HslVU (ClpYQ) peptidase subunit
MTTIVGVQGDGFAVICVDSRISTMFAGGLAQVGTLKEGSSKVSTNGKYLLGAAGDVRAINILHHVFQPPTPPPNLRGKKLDQFFTAKFIPALRECFDAQGYSVPDLNENKEHIAEQGSSILVAINGTIYIVDGDYSWASESNGIYSVGSGSSYALGAMQVLLRSKKTTLHQAKSSALRALAIASKFDPYTGPPYQTFVQTQEVSTKRRKTV